MSWVKSVPGFRDSPSLVNVYAPGDFPEEDYLAKDEQLNLERAFVELHHGLELLAADRGGPTSVSELRMLLDGELAAHRDGDDIRGAHPLQAFEARAFA